MTILDMLTSMHKNNDLMTKALQIIKDDFTSLVNDNYELTIDEKGNLMVKIPSLEKKDEFVYTSIIEYKYTLVMCMRVSELRDVEKYNFMLGKFMELYEDKLKLFFKDVHTVDILMEDIKKTKNNIDNVTYASMVVMILGAILLCVLPNITQTAKFIFILVMVLSPILSIIIQFGKEGQVKKVIDGYISIIKTEWYSKELSKQYVFLCNFMG